jgi:hypothetical protein
MAQGRRALSSPPWSTDMTGDEDSSQTGSLEFGVDAALVGVGGCGAGSAAVRHPAVGAPLWGSGCHGLKPGDDHAGWVQTCVERHRSGSNAASRRLKGGRCARYRCRRSPTRALSVSQRAAPLTCQIHRIYSLIHRCDRRTQQTAPPGPRNSQLARDTMSLPDAVRTCPTKYLDFSGRARMCRDVTKQKCGTSALNACGCSLRS